MRFGDRSRGRGEVAIERRRVAVGALSVAYEIAGAGPPLVLVHGLSGSTRWWRRNVSALAGRHRVHVVDLVGFGRSRGGSRFVLAEAAAVLAAWMERVGIGRAGVVGHSLGGYVAAELAADFPERVDRLVLVDPAALPFQLGRLRHGIDLVRSLRRTPIGFLPLLLGDAGRAGPVTLLGATRQLLAADLRPKLSRVAAPTLVLWGERDVLVPAALGRRLVEVMPDARLVVIAGAGHSPMWDRAEAFNRAVLEFLDEDARAGGPGRIAATDAAGDGPGHRPSGNTPRLGRDEG